MKIYLTDQKKNFTQHLEYFKTEKVMSYDKTRLTEKTSVVEINTAINFDQIQLDFLFAYKIFPANIMIYRTEWEEEKRKMKVGDTIVQQVCIPPVKTLSQKIIFGVRVKEIIDQPEKKGFSYETLEGHVEMGISTFTIEQVDGKTLFRIQTHSKPGNLLPQLLGPLFSVPYQTYCTNEALKNVKRQIENNLNLLPTKV